MKFNTRGLKKEFLTATTNDEVHGSIELCPITKELMSTPQVQRLRQLKQLGTSDFTYINTTHTRFEHSLGVCHLAGELLTKIDKRQPQLGITPKDIVCVKIAGLTHDLGHGPYSHVFDGVFRKQLKLAEEKDPTIAHKDMPEPMEGWAHEDASLMMIDAMLKHMGLEIDECNLDEPLKQIGDGVDAKRFGLWDRMSELELVNNDEDSDEESAGYYTDDDDTTMALPNELVLTSRDWVFIKECIAGCPLPPRGVSIESFKKSDHDAELIGRPVDKEFLYDVVNNRHSGLDVDKVDYLARDTMRAHGSNCIADLMNKMTEKSFVAWGKCGNPSTCWKCKQVKKGTKQPSIGDMRDCHLMICYQDNMAQNLMSFFEQRYLEHQRLYTHPKTARTNYMICDILLLAEQHFRIVSIDDNGNAGIKLPISLAMTNPDVYLELTDTVLDKVLNTECSELQLARQLIKRLRKHGKYLKAGYDIITDEPCTQVLWDMSETEIVDGILKQSEMDMINEGSGICADDIIVDKNKIHHGKKEKNPVDSLRFLPKKCHGQLLNSADKLPVAKQINSSLYRKPDIFQQQSIRIFCRNSDKSKQKLLAKYYKQFSSNLRYESECLFEEVDQSPNDTETVDALPSVTQTPEKYDDCSPQRNKRQRYEDDESFLTKVKKRINNGNH